MNGLSKFFHYYYLHISAPEGKDSSVLFFHDALCEVIIFRKKCNCFLHWFPGRVNIKWKMLICF